MISPQIRCHHPLEVLKPHLLFIPTSLHNIYDFLLTQILFKLSCHPFEILDVDVPLVLIIVLFKRPGDILFVVLDVRLTLQNAHELVETDSTLLDIVYLCNDVIDDLVGSVEAEPA